ncbi:MAG: 3-phosphoshikimate 1-carboxyvinyltransferase [Bacteroidia bacterium]|jgi:3-phosphoshikimate 1-carboxyvinyltransferase|nr:3-phosphoshikimate 1-carboxyvinyltransferase [Bacteroidia bacterium]
MSTVTVWHPTGIVNGTVTLPTSKSISNRVLLLNAVSGGKTVLQNLSDATDTVLMQTALKHHQGTIDLQNAGTCYRFLTAYYAATPNTDVVLLGDDRMQMRPIKPLVEALRNLGASINYLQKEGFPPIAIQGKTLNGGHVRIDASVSSQFVSALLLSAPLLQSPLHLLLEAGAASLPYLHLTIGLLKQWGYEVSINQQTITVYQYTATTPSRFTVEPDWSAAAFWYEVMALSKGGTIQLNQLSLQSLQGDKEIANWMQSAGVVSSPNNKGILIQQSTLRDAAQTVFNLVNHPDAAPAMAATAAGLNLPWSLTGLQNLAVKESNRVVALCKELGNCGYTLAGLNENSILQIQQQVPNKGKSNTETLWSHHDHRIAMALAPLSLVNGALTIRNAEAVSKSYPTFWDQLTQVGFEVNQFDE